MVSRTTAQLLNRTQQTSNCFRATEVYWTRSWLETRLFVQDFGTPFRSIFRFCPGQPAPFKKACDDDRSSFRRTPSRDTVLASPRYTARRNSLTARAKRFWFANAFSCRVAVESRLANSVQNSAGCPRPLLGPLKCCSQIRSQMTGLKSTSGHASPTGLTTRCELQHTRT